MKFHSCPKHAEIDKYTKNKLCTKLALFTRLYRDAKSTKYKDFHYEDYNLLECVALWPHIHTYKHTCTYTIFQRNLLPPTSTLKMQLIHSSKTLVSTSHSRSRRPYFLKSQPHNFESHRFCDVHIYNALSSYQQLNN